MSIIKKYDLCVSVGSYEKNGETKKKWRTVGSIMEKEDKSKFIFIDPTFNFAAVRRDEGRDNVLVSMFEPKAKEDKPQQEAWEE